MKLHVLISVNKGGQFLLCLVVEEEKHFINLPSKYFTIVQVHCLVVSMLCHLRQDVKLWAAHCKIY